MKREVGKPLIVLDECNREIARLRARPRLADSGFHHIGSSAVPGMPCKPVIDILVTIEGDELGDQVVDAKTWIKPRPRMVWYNCLL